jgi:tetratricopeptide (TPR) repeat protein
MVMEINKLGLNEFYGHSLIIKQYCGYPENLPLPLVIQHGSDAYYNLFEITTEYLFDYWVWDEAVKDMNINKYHLPPQTIHVLGSPFIYLADEVKPSLPVCERKGTIAFPQHSTPCAPAREGFQEYARQLQALPDQFHPITVCLHPYDISQGLHIPFQENGFTVISCVPDVLAYYEDIVKNPRLFWQIYTQSYSPSYLTNFINYCADKKYATANFSSTPTYYSIYLGLEFFWYGNKTQYTTGQYHLSSPEDVQYYQRMEASLSLTDEGEVPDWDTQWQIASGRLGVKHKMGKDELLSYLNNLYQSRPYVEGLRQKFVLLDETQIQVQNLEVQLQQSLAKLEDSNNLIHKIQDEKDTLQLQLDRFQLVKEIIQFVLKQTQSKLEHNYARLNDEQAQANTTSINSNLVNDRVWDLEALFSHKKALEAAPDNPLAYHRLGKALIELGYLEEGIVCYNHSLLLDDKIDIIYVDLAETMIKLGCLKKATTYYSRAAHLKLLKKHQLRAKLS